MINKLFELLSLYPVLSIALGFILAGVLAVTFRDVIKEYIRKKYNLSTPLEVESAKREAVTEYQRDRIKAQEFARQTRDINGDEEY